MIGALMTYVFLKAATPNVGKLSKPQESPTPLKNHLKKLQAKLRLMYFTRQRTFFLQGNTIKMQKHVKKGIYLQKLKWCMNTTNMHRKLASLLYSVVSLVLRILFRNLEVLIMHQMVKLNTKCLWPLAGSMKMDWLSFTHLNSL